eukprot:jgi/Psemu1/40519/gm1.40519_g
MSMTSLSAQEEGRAFVEAAEVSQLHFLLALFFLMLQWKLPQTQQPDTSTNWNLVTQDPLAFAVQRKRERRKKLAMKAMKKLFPSLSKDMVTRSNTLNKGHLCLKWHSATKVQRAQHRVKSINPGYGWKIEVVRDPTAKPPALSPTPEKIGEADLLNTLDWLVAPLMTNHCLQWVDDEPTCAMNFASMEFPIFARDTEDMEASAAGPDIQLAQSWESPSTINSKATNIPGLEEDLISTIRCKDGHARFIHLSRCKDDARIIQLYVFILEYSPVAATTDQLRFEEGAVVTAEKKRKKRNMTKPHSLGQRGALEIEKTRSID